MKQYGYLLLGVLLAAAGCGEDSEVFYSTSYPVVRVEASVTGPESGDDTTDGSDDSTTDGSDSSTDGESDDSTTKGSDSTTDGSDGSTTEPDENPLFAQIKAEIVAQAPVQAGGRYRIDFTSYNGGPATILPSAGAESITGTFIKVPGSSDIQFLFGEQDYTCTSSSYKGENNASLVLFTVDLTARYQELYPDAGITRAVRLEYTSASY